VARHALAACLAALALCALVGAVAGGPGAAAAAGAAAGPLPAAGASAGADAPGGPGDREKAGDRADAAPARVVSMNLCTDQLAMLLAAPGQLVSVSHVARDPVASVLWREATGYPANRAQAEEIHLLEPDLVLAGEFDNPATIAMFERLGLRVERFPLETRLADVRANMRRMGALLGNPAGAEALVEELDASLPPPPAADAPRPRAVLYGANGFTSGSGSLADAVLEAAGLANVAAELGIAGMARLPLEALILAEPDLVVTGRAYRGAALAHELVRHPAARGFDGARHVAVDNALWTCGTPRLGDAAAGLRAAAGLDERRPDEDGLAAAGAWR
jgi:iron complex transport system substrate-binding protein